MVLQQRTVGVHVLYSGTFVDGSGHRCFRSTSRRSAIFLLCDLSTTPRTNASYSSVLAKSRLWRSTRACSMADFVRWWRCSTPPFSFDLPGEMRVDFVS